MAGVSLCLVRFQLDSLLGIDEHLRVVVDQGERDGAVGVESRVPQVGASWVGEVSRHLWQWLEDRIPCTVGHYTRQRPSWTLFGSFWKGSRGTYLCRGSTSMATILGCGCTDS